MSLSDRVVVMRDGVIQQVGPPSEIYEHPDSQFVAGFVGKVAFFPVDVVDAPASGPVACSLAGKSVMAGSDGAGHRQESPADGPSGVPPSRTSGRRCCDGTVTTNVYLGSSVESFVATEYGETLVQIDDPSMSRVPKEGSRVSISFDETRVRLLPVAEG